MVRNTDAPFSTALVMNPARRPPGVNRHRVEREQGFSAFGEGVLCLGGAGDPTRPEHSGNSSATTVSVPIRLEL
jgi:hypothetical protein